VCWLLAAIMCVGLDLPVDRPEPLKPEPPRPPEPEVQEDEKPPTIYGSEIPSESSSVVFVLDDSGSMALDWRPDSGNRLDRAKTELSRAIESLPANWKFTVYAYDCAYWSWSETLQAANEENKKSALAWIRGLSPAGGTATHSGTCAALKIRENKLVVLLTDGAPSCAGGNDEQRAAIKAANLQGATINVFGISCDHELMRTFCRDVASDNNGTFTEVR
jgi:hypothetical protein